MYYRIFDEESKSFIPSVYNEENKKELKESMKIILLDSLSHEDVKEVIGLKQDQFECKLKELGYRVDSQSTPFDTEGVDSELAWDDYLEDYPSDEDDFNDY